MEHRCRVLLVVLSLLTAACGDGEESSVSPPVDLSPSADVVRASVDRNAPVTELAAGFNDAGFDLLRTQPLDLNLVFSPTSIGHAVLMARDAGDDATLAAIDAAFGLPEARPAHDAWNAIDLAIDDANRKHTALSGEPTPVVTVAGRVWPAQAAQPDQAWLDLLASHHGAETETIDVSRPDQSARRINQWISDETQGLIPELVSPTFITPSTQLVLTDAVYFEAQWARTFGKYGNSVVQWQRLDGTTSRVEAMRDLELPGPRGRGEGYDAVELGYLGDAYSMLLIVPEVGRFDEFRERLSSAFLAEVDAGLTTGPFELLMPPWTTSSKVDLLPWLTDLGVAPGSYPGIGAGSFLGGAVHGAEIEVDEHGTVAAAATALGFLSSGPPDPELTISVDRPFHYVIRHVDTGLVLFAGQVTDPT